MELMKIHLIPIMFKFPDKIVTNNLQLKQKLIGLDRKKNRIFYVINPSKNNIKFLSFFTKIRLFLKKITKIMLLPNYLPNYCPEESYPIIRRFYMPIHHNPCHMER